MTLVDYKHPSTIPIVDGHISFFIPDYDLQITAKVKQVKGRGTADADELTILSEQHKMIIEAMIKRGIHRQHWEANDILRACKFDLMQRDPNREFKENNWRRPISELLRRGILIKTGLNTLAGGRVPNYELDIAKGEKAVWSGKFEP